MNIQQQNDAMTGYKSSFMKNGYALIKNVFTAEEIDHFRMLAYKIRFDQGDLLASKHLSMLVYDKRITSIAKAIIGSEIFYFGDSACNFNGPITNYHKDNADRYNQDGPDWQKEEYSVIRIGIYLQDHKNHSQGLSIRRGSHQFPDFTSGTPVYMDSEIGDVVVWSLKTTHMGMTDATKDNKTPLSRNHNMDVAKVLPPPECDRIAIFISYGNNSPETIRFMDYLRTREYAINRWNHSIIDPGIKVTISESDIQLIDIHERVLKQNRQFINLHHKPIPADFSFNDYVELST